MTRNIPPLQSCAISLNVSGLAVKRNDPAQGQAVRDGSRVAAFLMCGSEDGAGTAVACMGITLSQTTQQKPTHDFETFFRTYVFLTAG